jgi:hypothetical protein
MVGKKVFILDSHCGVDGVGLALIQTARNMGMELGKDLEMRCSEDKDKYRRELPKDYDIYLIHPSDTSEEALIDLRREQPWSNIVCISGLYPDYSSDFWDLFDERYGILVEEDRKRILELGHRKF